MPDKPEDRLKEFFGPDPSDEDLGNILVYTNPGTEVVLAFGGLGAGYGNYRYEFLKLTRNHDCSRIYCRDIRGIWYHAGINNEINSIPSLKKELDTIVSKLQPTKLVCLGASTGGFAALLFGHMLKANTVHAFGPQTFLSKELRTFYNNSYDLQRWPKNMKELHSLDLSPASRYFDLREVLEEDNGITSYHVHVCSGYEGDNLHAFHIRHCPNVYFHYYDCDIHSVAGYLKKEGKLEELLEQI